jgi:hypothetical protein
MISVQHITKPFSSFESPGSAVRKGFFWSYRLLNPIDNTVKRMKPFVGIVEHIRRDLSWSHPICLEEPVQCACSGFHDFALREAGQKLAHVSDVTMEMIVCVLTHTYQPNPSYRKAPPLQSEDIIGQRKIISESVERMREVLRGESHHFLTHGGQPAVSERSSEPRGCRRADDLALFMTTLLHVSLYCKFNPSHMVFKIADEVSQGLLICETLCASRRNSAVRLWIPKFSSVWLGLPPKTVLFEGEQLARDLGTLSLLLSLTTLMVRAYIAYHNPSLEDSDLCLQEQQEGIAEKVEIIKEKIIDNKWWEKQARRTKSMWTRPQTLKLRFLVSKGYRAWRHSPHIRHG